MHVYWPIQRKCGCDSGHSTFDIDGDKKPKAKETLYGNSQSFCACRPCGSSCWASCCPACWRGSSHPRPGERTHSLHTGIINPLTAEAEDDQSLRCKRLMGCKFLKIQQQHEWTVAVQSSNLMDAPRTPMWLMWSSRDNISLYIQQLKNETTATLFGSIPLARLIGCYFP